MGAKEVPAFLWLKNCTIVFFQKMVLAIKL